MGRPKALLPDAKGVPFVVRIAGTLAEAGLEDIVVVAADQEEVIREALSAYGAQLVRVIRNPDPRRGQLSSLQAGMAEALDRDTEGVLVTLVDIPLVSAATVMKVRDAWRARRAPITRPSVGARHGHPVIFDRRVFEALQSASLDIGAKQVVRAHGPDVENVPVDDAGCLLDVDTPADYERLRSTAREAD